MRTLDAIARILKTEGIERLICRRERAGVGIADFPARAQDETRARIAAFFRSGSMNEALAGLRRGKKARE